MHGINKTVYIIAALVSVILSLCAAMKTSVINPDGFCYLQSAVDMSQGLSTAMHLCDQAKWPFYSMLIFAVMKLTHLNEIPAAFLLNGMLTLISVLTFIAITEFLTQSKRIIWLATAVILLAKGFNLVRTEVVRDHGFWAFYLISILCLLHYFKRYYFRDALLWSAALITAAFFRIEGAVFLFLLPFAAFCDYRRTALQRVTAFFQLNIVTLIGMIFLISHSQQSFGRLDEVFNQFQHGLTAVTQHFQLKSAALSRYVLSAYSAHDANAVLLLTLISWYIVSAASNLSLVYTALVVYAWWKKLLPNLFSARLVLWSYVVINVLITAIFFEENFFLTKRYLMAQSITLMFWVPFALHYLIGQWRVRKWPLIVAIFFMTFYALGGMIDFGYSKKYIRDAGDWLSTHVPAGATLYSNDLSVMYYSHHFGDALFKKQSEFRTVKIENNWRQYDYLALLSARHDAGAKIAQKIPLAPVQIYMNKRGDEVAIYKVN